MKIVMKRAGTVRLQKGQTVEVSEQEAKRLFAFGLAEEAPKPKRKKKEEKKEE